VLNAGVTDPAQLFFLSEKANDQVYPTLYEVSYDSATGLFTSIGTELFGQTPPNPMPADIVLGANYNSKSNVYVGDLTTSLTVAGYGSATITYNYSSYDPTVPSQAYTIDVSGSSNFGALQGPGVYNITFASGAFGLDVSAADPTPDNKVSQTMLGIDIYIFSDCIDPDGTPSSPNGNETFVADSPAELQMIDDVVSLGGGSQDINFKLTDTGGNGYDMSSLVLPAEGFNPIGSATVAYNGNFDGGDVTINNLTINRPTEDYVGLFASTGQNAKISGINIEAGGSITGKDYVGGVAGSNQGQIINSYNKTAVSGVGVTGNVGGFVGANSDGGAMLVGNYSLASVQSAG
jgi:hypothetical protein